MIIPERLLLHPILLNRRSRAIFFWYSIAAVLVTALLWWRIDQIAAEAGVTLSSAVNSAPPLAKILYQPYIRAVIVILSAALATGLTAVAIVGPVRRLEDWLTAWEMGVAIRPLKVRSGDQYETVIRLLNELHEKAERTRAQRKTKTPMHKPMRPSRRSS